MNPMVLMQIQERLTQFKQDHPKFFPFLGAVKDTALREGSVIDIKVTTPEGKSLATNIRLTANDIETIGLLLSGDGRG